MNARGGFSLVEITMSLILLSFLIAGLGGLVVRTQQQYNQSQQATRSSEALRTAETTVATLLKSSAADPYNSGAAAYEPDYLGRGRFDNFRARSDFNPPDGLFDQMFEDTRVYVATDTLWIQWSASMDPQPVAAPVHDLLFEHFDADQVLLTTAPDIAARAVTVKMTLETVGPSATHRSVSWIFLRNTL